MTIEDKAQESDWLQVVLAEAQRKLAEGKQPARRLPTRRNDKG